MPKSEQLQIRLTPADKARLAKAAKEEYIDESAWARRAILQALDEAERAEGGKGRKR
jgi:hypothetical protein